EVYETPSLFPLRARSARPAEGTSDGDLARAHAPFAERPEQVTKEAPAEASTPQTRRYEELLARPRRGSFRDLQRHPARAVARRLGGVQSPGTDRAIDRLVWADGRGRATMSSQGRDARR